MLFLQLDHLLLLLFVQIQLFELYLDFALGEFEDFIGVVSVSLCRIPVTRFFGTHLGALSLKVRPLGIAYFLVCLNGAALDEPGSSGEEPGWCLIGGLLGVVKGAKHVIGVAISSLLRCPIGVDHLIHPPPVGQVSRYVLLLHVGGLMRPRSLLQLFGRSDLG